MCSNNRGLTHLIWQMWLCIRLRKCQTQFGDRYLEYLRTLELIPEDLAGGKLSLVQVKAWCRQATSLYLNQYKLGSPTAYGVTKPQWVKVPFVLILQYATNHYLMNKRYHLHIFLLTQYHLHIFSLTGLADPSTEEIMLRRYEQFVAYQITEFDTNPSHFGDDVKSIPVVIISCTFLEQQPWYFGKW